MTAIKMVKTLPEDIVDHPHLRDATKLDLREPMSTPRLVTLPERFGELTNLKKLDLGGCELVSLPEGILYPKTLDALSIVSALYHGFADLSNFHSPKGSYS